MFLAYNCRKTDYGLPRIYVGTHSGQFLSHNFCDFWILWRLPVVGQVHRHGKLIIKPYIFVFLVN